VQKKKNKSKLLVPTKSHDSLEVRENNGGKIEALAFT
jgi:hypothetical protein